MKRAKAKQAKTTKRPTKKKSAPKAQLAPVGHGMEARLEAEFADAMRTAKSYVTDAQRLRALFQEAAKEITTFPREVFRDTWPYLQAMLRLLRAYYRGDYRAITESTLIVIIAAIIYVVSPLDVIPDAVPALGFLDDATVIALALRRTQQDLDDFMIWETSIT